MNRGSGSLVRARVRLTCGCPPYAGIRPPAVIIGSVPVHLLEEDAGNLGHRDVLGAAADGRRGS